MDIHQEDVFELAYEASNGEWGDAEGVAEDAWHEVDEVSRIIGVPWQEWPGKCHEIAHRCIEANIIDGVLVYGSWLGDILNESIFAGKPFAHHGWVQTCSGLIFDPTRWTFASCKHPWLWLGKPTNEYDAESARTNRELMGAIPNPHGKIITINVPKPIQEFLTEQCKAQTTPSGLKIDLARLAWILRLHPKYMPFEAKDFYAAIDQASLKALIPIDYSKFMQ